jgi:hypothetical protein
LFKTNTGAILSILIKGVSYIYIFAADIDTDY